MSVVIRMQRAGGRNYPFFRVVVADSRRARDGRFLEKVGYYNPLSRPAQVQLDQERMRFWMERGARPSESVAVLLKRFQSAHPVAAGSGTVTPPPAPAPQEAAGPSAGEGSAAGKSPD